MQKIVNGELIDMTDEEVAEIAAFQAVAKQPAQEDYKRAIVAMLDEKAQERRYDSALSLSTYATSSNPAWYAEANAFVTWRDSVWAYAYEQLALVAIARRPLPTVEDFLKELPAFTWPTP